MSLELLLNDSGLPYEQDAELVSDANEGKVCTYQGISFQCSSALEAQLNLKTFNKVTVDVTPTTLPSIAHECTIDGIPYIMCFLGDLYSLPTEVERAVLSCVFWHSIVPTFSNGESYFLSQEGFDPFCHKILYSSLTMSMDSTFLKYSNSVFVKDTNDWISKDKVCRHLILSYPNFTGKYGFLELYRGMEVTHLSSVKKVFNDNILIDAKSAISKTKTALSTDKNTLASFATETSVTSYFSKIYNEVNLLKMAGNSYASVLINKSERDASQHPTSMTQQCWQGCTIVYQIRCSVAHAGAVGIVVEDYDDNAEVFLKINPIIEEILLTVLGFDFP